MTTFEATEAQLQRRERYRQRYFRRRLHTAGMIDQAGAAWCGSPAGAEVEIAVMLDGATHVSGLQSCKSPWKCPVCAPKIRQRRSVEIEEVTKHVLASGGMAQFVTVTMQHSAHDDFGSVVEDLQRCWSAAWNSAEVAEWRKLSGMVGKVRVIEPTYGAANGWHPHIHALLFFMPDDSNYGPCADWAPESGFHSFPTLGETRRMVLDRWQASVLRHTGRAVSRRVGVNVQPVTFVEGISGYLAKVDGGWSLGNEMTRGDLKKSRGRFTPVELLDAAMDGEGWALKAWCQYEAGITGARFVQWDPTLRARLGFAEEMTDEEAVSYQSGTVEVYRAAVSGSLFLLAWSTGDEWRLIEEVERVPQDRLWRRLLSEYPMCGAGSILGPPAVVS